MRARLPIAALAGALVFAGTSATPAAAQTITTVNAKSWAYIDSAAPRTAFVDPKGDAPVGAHTDGKGTKHVSKSYVTFDLSALKASTVQRAVLITGETSVTECAEPRGTEVWLTEPARRPTWDNQPAELVKASGPFLDGRCPSPDLTWTVTAGVQNALAAGRNTAAFVLRLPETQLADVKFGRVYNPAVRLVLTYDRLPDKPVELTINNEACTAKPRVVSRQAQLGATVTDPDENHPGAEYALWPIDHPDQRVTFPNGGTGVGNKVWADAGQLLTEGVTYGWQLRGKDYEGGYGPWSAVCKFKTDFTPPAAAPIVTSTDYTDTFPGTGGTGIPGSFTFDAKGDKDVVGFAYGGSVPSTYVAADKPGGKAVIDYAPTQDGPTSIRVRGVDAAGNSSPSTDYRFWVATNNPQVSCTPASAYVGEPRQCSFKPRGTSAVTAYVYRLNYGPETTVPAGADGTATATIVPDDPDVNYHVSVRSKLAGGYLTSSTEEYFQTEPGTPILERHTAQPILGSTVEFALRAVLPGSATFTYRWAEDEPKTVPVGADGTATVTVTARASGLNSFSAHSTTAKGQRSGGENLYVDVASNQPKVTSVEYPESETSGAVGLPGTFTFQSPVQGVTSYTYAFNTEQPVTVAADAAGTAVISYTPAKTYINYLTVTSTLADGTVSESKTYYFYVAYQSPRVSCDNSGWVTPGQVIRCAISPVQANLASYGYIVGEGQEVVLQPDADGKAAVEFTVPAGQAPGSYLRLRVWSVNTAGVRSDEYVTSFYVSSSSS